MFVKSATNALYTYRVWNEIRGRNFPSHLFVSFIFKPVLFVCTLSFSALKLCKLLQLLFLATFFVENARNTVCGKLLLVF